MPFFSPLLLHLGPDILLNILFLNPLNLYYYYYYYYYFRIT
jgi:hypothetical protein